VESVVQKIAVLHGVEFGRGSGRSLLMWVVGMVNGILHGGTVIGKVPERTQDPGDQCLMVSYELSLLPPQPAISRSVYTLKIDA